MHLGPAGITQVQIIRVRIIRVQIIRARTIRARTILACSKRGQTDGNGLQVGNVLNRVSQQGQRFVTGAGQNEMVLGLDFPGLTFQNHPHIQNRQDCAGHVDHSANHGRHVAHRSDFHGPHHPVHLGQGQGIAAPGNAEQEMGVGGMHGFSRVTGKMRQDLIAVKAATIQIRAGEKGWKSAGHGTGFAETTWFMTSSSLAMFAGLVT